MKPNFGECQECPYWDDVNGCWGNCDDVCEHGFIDEFGNFDDEQWDKHKEKQMELRGYLKEGGKR